VKAGAINIEKTTKTPANDTELVTAIAKTVKNNKSFKKLSKYFNPKNKTIPKIEYKIKILKTSE
jgi:hypothetical protein